MKFQYFAIFVKTPPLKGKHVTIFNCLMIRVACTALLCMILNYAEAQVVNTSDDVVDCEALTLTAVNQLANGFSQNRFHLFDEFTKDWIKHCGVSECTQRLIILNNIIERKPSQASIQVYFENNFHDVFWDRVHYAKRIDFGYVYSSGKLYFGYVPLRHPVDSVVAAASNHLMKTQTLEPDEKLLCLLFSGDIDGYEKEIEKSEYDNGFIKPYLLNKLRANYDRGMGFTLYSGAYRPLSNNGVFANSPMVGFTFSSRVTSKFMAEIGVKVRMNINDKSFEYIVNGDTNTVNSKASVFFGGVLGYTIYERPKFMVMPKIGAGLEMVHTGITTQDKNEDEENHDIETLHVSFGCALMFPVAKKSYFGFGINYHYCPYDFDDNLITKFSNNLVSTEVFYRF